MKKSQLVTLEKEQLDKENLNIVIERLEDGLQKVDEIPVYTPNLQWFEQMVLTEKQRVRTRQRKELALFLITALFILSGILMSLYQMPVLFILLQILTPIFLVIYTGVRFKRKANLNE